MEWKIVPVMAGEFGMVRDDIRFAGGSPKNSSFVPSYVYLIECGEEQYIVDTSFGDPDICQERMQLIVKRDEELSTLLSKAGIRADKVKGLILTHLHWDHAANCMLFPRAAVYCQKEEIDCAFDAASDYDEYYLREFEKSRDRLIAVDGNYNVRDGILLRKCGGHTRGSQSVEVMTEQGLAVITGDTVMTYENLDKKVPVGYCTEPDRCSNMLYYLLSKKPRYILPSHDYKTLHYKKESMRLFGWDR